MTLLICAATFIFTISGGIFALKCQRYRPLILAFSAGAMIAVALFDLVPAALELSYRVYSMRIVSGTAALGFVFYLIIDQSLSFIDHNGQKRDNSNYKPVVIASFLCIHSFLDGVAIGLAYQVSTTIGAIIAVAILVHDFADGMNTANVVLSINNKKVIVFKWIIANASAPFLGVASTYLYRFDGSTLGILIAFISGCFIYIGAVEFLPESRLRSQGWKSTLTTVAGLVVLFLAIHFSGK